MVILGNKITEYMIVVYTGAGELEGDEMTLDDYLDNFEPLKVGLYNLI